MGGVSKEQIEAAKEVDILDYLMSREADNIRMVGGRHVLRDHDSFVISNGKWCWNSQKIGCKTATALNYLIKLRDYSFVDAVRELTDGTSYNRDIPQKANSPPIPKKFVLPIHNRDNKRVIAYLQSRGIDRKSILDCIKNGSLYESAQYHNCVFVGRDERGKAHFAAMRGTLANFRRDIDGSNKSFGFVIPPDNPSSTAIAVFEAPIDCLSHQTLCKQGFIESFDGWRLSLGGTSLLALIHFLENHPNINTCRACTDNDEAGNFVAEKIAELTDIKTVRSLPIKGTDFNEMLLAFQKAERMNNRTMCGNERGV